MKKYRRNCPLPPSPGGLPLITAALISLGFVSASSAQVQNAGDLLVNLDATTLEEGSLSTISNTGSLGGVFEARGGEGTIPTVATEGGTKGIRFDGSDFMQLVDAAGGTLLPPPDGLVGVDPTRSIEVWVLNPDVANEETMVSWGKRGGPDGTNVSFGYGSDYRWGAMGHWGGDGPDLAWDNNGGNPTPNKWHHLVYTYDGTMSRVYVDGKFANSEFLGAGRINTHAGTSLCLATQLEGDGVTQTGGLRGSLTLARVRIHDEVLTLNQIKNNYDVEKAAFVDPAPAGTIAPERLSVAPVNRYSFNDAPSSDASNSVITDSIGEDDGVVLGLGTEYTGSRLRLSGGGSGDSGYGDLPNGLLSRHGAANGGSGEFSIEGWIRHVGSQTWSRIFDFGSTIGGEVTAPGGGGEGRDYLMYTLQNGDDVNTRQVELRNEDPGGGGVATAAHSTATFNTDLHFAVTWNEATGLITAYENGRRVASLTTDDPMSDVNDVNVWLGRSNWTADRNAQAEFDEVRMYSHVLTPGEVVGNFLAGPEVLNNADTPASILSHPTSRTVPDATEVTFRVAASGSTPITYQWLRNGAEIAGATAPSYTFVATSGDNGAQYSCRVVNIVAGNPVAVTSTPATLTVQGDAISLRHRYSFNEEAGATETVDALGGAPGLLVDGASMTGDGQVTLDGVASYVNLPNGIISELGNATLEFWTTSTANAIWSRVFDFGASVEGEDLQGTGQEFLFFTPKMPAGFPRFIANAPGGGGDTTTMNMQGSFPLNEEVHLAVTYSSTAQIARLYLNGELMASALATFPLNTLSDVNNWLGRSQFRDAYYAGSFNEVRIYDGAMSSVQIAASFAAGPNATIGEARPSLALTTGAGGSASLRWPAAAAGYKLESRSSFAPGTSWEEVTTAPVVDGASLKLDINTASGTKYYRLSK
ncbi:MAG: hypothetical protein JNN07_02140 [Verrucomicrobiales bacterium]|nr:hypothetical protein [Verrucomicrobiales bacterium]